jgi:hypothetical protein
VPGVKEVSLLRRLRVVASTRLSLAIGEVVGMRSFWDLPETTRTEVLRMLAGMISKGVVEDDKDGADG